MARKFQFECDGCGVEQASEKDKTPAGWTDVTVKLEGVANVYLRPNEGAFSVAALLCASCINRLVDYANPHEWPRSAKACPL